MPPTLCGDDALGYRAARSPIEPGCGLALDARYRLAHLPLVAPDHPRVIATKAGTSYERGRHPPVASLVLRVPAEALEAAPAYRELDAALRAAPFAQKIAWALLPRRRDRLHATLCPAPAAGLGVEARTRLAALPPFTVELRGLFSGTINVGRLYLRAYPECRDGANAIHAVQAATGAGPTSLYLVGIWNLVDDLDAAEAAALDALLTAWWDRPILTLRVEALDVLVARDDLVLDAEWGERVRLGA